MTDLQLYTKISKLPLNKKTEVSHFIDAIKLEKANGIPPKKNRLPGKAKGLIEIKSNFDDPVESFNEYL